MANVIDLPDFMFIEKNKPSKFSKLIFFFKGLLIGFIYKKFHKKIFCFFINLFFKKDGKINYSNGMYYKVLEDDSKIRYPNKRIDRVVVNHKLHFENLFNSYCLNYVNFENTNLVIDCGSNVGELFYSLKFKNINSNYYAFEPDSKNFECLKLNIDQKNSKLFEIGLSDSEGIKSFYIDNEGADSSLEFFGSNNKVDINTNTLDFYNLKKIKLFKLEAEGHEFEVLKGASKTLKEIEYISVDYGPEKGIEKDTTIAEVTNYLFENNFEMVKGSKFRRIGLFKNKLI